MIVHVKHQLGKNFLILSYLKLSNFSNIVLLKSAVGKSFKLESSLTVLSKFLVGCPRSGHSAITSGTVPDRFWFLAGG